MSNQLVITSGAKVRSLEGVLTGTSGVVNALGINVANGIPQLDGSGKILVSQLPNSVMEYKGTWNVTTNTPYLVNGVGNAGDVYIVTGAAVGGTNHDFGAGNILFYNGDQAIYDGSAWQRASGSSGTVTSVAMTTPSGLSVSGSPITTSGTLALSLASGYTIPLSTQLVPTGGTTGQILAKNSNTAYDTTWIENYANWTEQIRDTVKASVVINKGQAVYISGANGTNQLVSLADNTTEATSSKTLGLAMQNFAINDIGQIVTEGLLGGLDTHTATAGDPVWLGTSGNLIFGLANKPAAPAHLVYIGVVTRANLNNGEIYVKIQNGFELQELHNVSITSPANGNILQYDSATSLWKNVAGTTTNIAEGTNLYYTDARARGSLSFAAGSGAYNSTTGVITIPTNNNQITNGASYITLGSLSASSPLSYNSGTGAFSISQANTTTNGYLSSTDWNTFNSKQSALTFSSPLVNTSGTISIPAATSLVNGYLTSSDWTTFNSKQSAITLTTTGSSGSSTFVSNTLNIPTYTLSGLGGQPLATNLTSLSGLTYVSSSFVKMTAAGTFSLDTNSYYLSSNPSSYITLTSLSAGTGISYNNTTGVIASTITQYTDAMARAAISLTTTGTSGAATYSSLTGVLNIPQYQAAGTYVTSVTGTSPISSSGGTTPAISISQATTSTNGYLSSTDWNTFNNKQNALTNPVTGTGTSNYLPKFTGTSTIGNSQITDNGSVITLTSSQTNFGLSGSIFYVYPAFSTNLNLLQNYNGSAYTTEEHRASDYSFKIGTTAALTIASSSAATFSSSVTATQLNATTTTAGYAAILTNTNGASDSNGLLVKAGSGSTEYNVRFANQTDTTTFFTVKGNGNVGIGTTSPSSNINPSAANILVLRNTSSFPSLVLQGPTGGEGGITSANELYIDNAGNSTASSNAIIFRNTNTNSSYSVTERMRITSGGNVGINTGSSTLNAYLTSYTTSAANQIKAAGTAPAITFSDGISSSTYAGVVGVATAANHFITGTAAGDMAIVNQSSSAGPIIFGTGTTERMRITAAGNVGIGTASPDFPLTIKTDASANSLKILGRSSGDTSISWNSADNATQYAHIDIGSSYFQIYASNSQPIQLYTGGSERMRITSAAAVYINGTASAIWSSSAASIAQISINDTFPFIVAKNDNICAILNRTNSNGVILEFKYNGSVVGSISTNANSLPSDLNFKKDITDISLGLNLVTKLRPVHYRYKFDEETEALSNGIIAQELEQSLLECGIEKNSLLMLQHKPNEKENESQYWIDYTKMIPVLIKAIQEQNQLIQELRTDIELLKNK